MRRRGQSAAWGQSKGRLPSRASVAPRIDFQFRDIELPFQPVKGVIADLLALPKLLQCFALKPQHLEAEHAPIRRVLRLFGRTFVSRSVAAMKSYLREVSTPELRLPLHRVV